MSVRKQRLEGFCTLCTEMGEGEQVDTTMVFVINYIIASSSKNYQLVICYIVIITILPQAGGQQGWRALVHAKKGEGGEDGQQVERLPLKMANPSYKVDRVPHILERIRSPSHVTTACIQTAWSFRGFLVK